MLLVLLAIFCRCLRVLRRARSAFCKVLVIRAWMMRSQPIRLGRCCKPCGHLFSTTAVTLKVGSRGRISVISDGSPCPVRVPAIYDSWRQHVSSNSQRQLSMTVVCMFLFCGMMRLCACVRPRGWVRRQTVRQLLALIMCTLPLHAALCQLAWQSSSRHGPYSAAHFRAAHICIQAGACHVCACSDMTLPGVWRTPCLRAV
jgi:hypothetical protein